MDFNNMRIMHTFIQPRKRLSLAKISFKEPRQLTIVVRSRTLKLDAVGDVLVTGWKWRWHKSRHP